MRRADGGECVSFTRPADATLPTTEVTPKTETTPPKTEDTPPKTEATPPATDATPPKTDTTKTDTAAADTKTATGDTTTTTAAVSAVAVTPAPGGVVLGGTKNVGSKMGLAWPNGEWTPEGEPGYLGNYIGTKTSWLYTWGPDPLKSAEAIGIEFVPMLWGPSDAHITAWHAAQATWPESTKNTLFFNEPNLFGTEVASGISAKDALPFWINDYLPVRTNLGMQLGGAGPTNGPDGLQWVLDFHDNCIAAGHPAADCTPDFAPVHFYISDLQQAKDYIQNFHDKTGLNVWVTEYACTDFSSYPAISPPYSDIVDYNQQLAAWMDEQAYVIRYAPFGEFELWEEIKAIADLQVRWRGHYMVCLGTTASWVRMVLSQSWASGTSDRGGSIALVVVGEHCNNIKS